jgi:hypothetical protein
MRTSTSAALARAVAVEELQVGVVCVHGPWLRTRKCCVKAIAPMLDRYAVNRTLSS